MEKYYKKIGTVLSGAVDNIAIAVAVILFWPVFFMENGIDDKFESTEYKIGKYTVRSVVVFIWSCVLVFGVYFIFVAVSVEP